MKVRNNFDKSAVFVAEEYLSCVNADTTERRALVSQLKNYIKGRRDNEVVNWGLFFITLQMRSSLHYVHQPVSRLLSEMRGLKEVKAVLDREELDGSDEIYVTGNGYMALLLDSVRLNVTHHFVSDPVVGPRLRNLIEAAKETGGEVWQGDKASCSQWMRFHGLEVPEDVEQTKNLLAFLEWEWPKTDEFGNYWAHLTGDFDEAIVLTPAQYAEIRALTAKFVAKDKSLLDTLWENAQPALSGKVDWGNANETIGLLVRHKSFRQMARKYLDGLGWYGSADDEDVTAHDRAQILITAVILDINPFIGTEEKRNSVGTYDIYEPRESVDKPLADIRQGLERHLVSSQRVSLAMAPLASHLLLASMAPGFLVKDLPSELKAGSIGWVSFTQAVALVEQTFRGVSRFMTYEQVMKFGNVDAVSSSVSQLQSVVAIKSIIDWALINEVITHEALAVSVKDAAEKAMLAYQEYVKHFVQGAEAFTTPLPSRQKIALAALEEAAPGCDFLKDRVLRHYSDNLSHSYKMSMLDLHIEGELASGDWDWREEGSLYERYPYLYALAPNEPVFEAQVSDHHRELHKALATNIKVAMAQMENDDREIFENNAITFFTLRPSVAERIPMPEGSVGYTGANIKNPPPTESQAKKDEATGRYSVVMCASHSNGKFVCYEMFSLRAKCRKNIRLGEMIHGSGKMNMPARIDFNGGMTDPKPPVTPFYLPIDLRSYTNGTEPRNDYSSEAVIEKLGTLPAPTSRPKKRRNAYQHFSNPRINDVAQFIVVNRPLASVKELTEAATEYTEREQGKATLDRITTYVVDLVVPFKKCIEDIASGERNRVVDGVFGCTMDAIGILFAFVGVPGKVLSIAGRAASLSAKFKSFAKFGLKLTFSIFNPLDGVGTGVYRGSKALYKSGLRLGGQGAHLVETASFQLRRLTGKADSVALLRVENFPHLGQGTWRPRGSSVDIVDICALRKNNDWFAVNRNGNAWGKRLTDFVQYQEFSFPGFRGPLPASYSRQIIQQSLPIASRKIDDAISVLSTPALNNETNLAIGLLLGSTPQSRDDLFFFLRLIKTDFNGFSISNFILDGAKDNTNLVEVNPLQYDLWKKSVSTGAADHQFLTINTQNLVDRFSSTGSSYGAVADDLIHEVFRAGPKKIDVVCAKAATQGQGMDVAPLLNLAAGRLPLAANERPVRYHNSQKALANADSFALITALLSQSKTDKAGYLKNIGIMSAAINGSAGRPIDTEVLVNLNTD
ncbi:hypothetical protein HKK52_02635 [Pseudomonas sp. ADAK2]|uniref:hypothetical protein n=1 Tax=unclassified Pseudomonas TaxID=196821 RepID=UPI00146409AD|nr:MULTISPECIES: hypothetical protein [unclassified Pseudomonas]QJI39866.1 hypothetical protein HKK53_02630 [Pseudomonas sp. ADAK7]QJI46172.1 hypothetical protein HKK52_02635 [Pseudomonas sp. ADAK2]